MAKIQNPIIGRATGQAGGMIFSKMYDKNVMRSRPLEVTPSNTPAQLRQREFVSEMGKYAAQTNPDILIDLYPNKPATRSRFSQFQKDLAAGRDVSGSVGTIDFDNVHKIGNGPNYLSGTGVTAAFTEAGSYQLDWSALSYSGPSLDGDNMYAYIFNTTRKDFKEVDTAMGFTDTGATVSVPDTWVAGDNVAAFVGVKHKAGAELSGTVK